MAHVLDILLALKSTLIPSSHDAAVKWMVQIALGSLTLLFFIRLLGPKRFKDEPPYINPKVPLIGHAIGLVRKRYGYLVDLFKTSNLPIFSLSCPGMPTGRIYVINSPALALCVERLPTKISFWHVEAVFTGTLAGLSPFAVKTLQKNVDGDGGQPSYLREGMLNAHIAMKPGEILTVTTRAAVDILALTFETLESGRKLRVELKDWVTDNLMTSVTGSIFGPNNPYKDPDVAKAFWDFQDNAGGLMSLPFPSVTCARSYTARGKVAAAFEEYYTAKGYSDASHWVQGATEVSNRYRISDKDKSRMDVSNSHAILANTAPTAFWTIYHIFSDASIVREVRTAVMPFLTTKKDNGTVTYHLDVSQIRDLPILRSVLSEALRHYANGTGTRIVVEDTLLDNRFLLKKGSFVFMPNRTYHFDPSAWGSAVENFDARRFMNSKTPRGSFRAFGGGANLCPGRFFAMTEILAMSAMLALRFDIKPQDETWVHPGIDDSNMTLIVQPPKEKILVDIMPREDWAIGRWVFTVI